MLRSGDGTAAGGRIWDKGIVVGNRGTRYDVHVTEPLGAGVSRGVPLWRLRRLGWPSLRVEYGTEFFASPHQAAEGSDSNAGRFPPREFPPVAANRVQTEWWWNDPSSDHRFAAVYTRLKRRCGAPGDGGGGGVAYYSDHSPRQPSTKQLLRTLLNGTGGGDSVVIPTSMSGVCIKAAMGMFDRDEEGDGWLLGGGGGADDYGDPRPSEKWRLSVAVFTEALRRALCGQRWLLPGQLVQLLAGVGLRLPFGAALGRERCSGGTVAAREQRDGVRLPKVVDGDWLLRLLLGSTDVGGFPVRVEPFPDFMKGLGPEHATVLRPSPGATMFQLEVIAERVFGLGPLRLLAPAPVVLRSRGRGEPLRLALAGENGLGPVRMPSHGGSRAASGQASSTLTRASSRAPCATPPPSTRATYSSRRRRRRRRRRRSPPAATPVWVRSSPAATRASAAPTGSRSART